MAFLPPNGIPSTSTQGYQPLVSCIMPTANRRLFVPRAIEYFLRQDYPNRELVILDDGADSVADLVPDDPRVRYLRITGQRTLGTKRNECVAVSGGDLIMHWDDDDWMAPNRISYQVEGLLRAGAEVCGVRRMLFYELANGNTWLYDYPANQRAWLAGGSLLYTRGFWKRAPFPSVQVGSDTRFVWRQRLDRAAVLPDSGFYIAMIHPGNTSPKSLKGSYWKRWEGDVREVLGADSAFYFSFKLPSPGAPVPVTASNEHTAQEIEARGENAQATTQEQIASMPEVQTMPEDKPAPTYSIIMVVHNGLEMTQLATLLTLRHSAGHDARLVVVDSGSNDGTEQWLRMLAQRGDIDLVRTEMNVGHGPGLEIARRQTSSPYIVTLDSDAFPLSDEWLPRLRSMLSDQVKVAGIRHHRDYIHPSCLMVARNTLDEFGLSFLNEKERPSNLDVAERISVKVKRRGYKIAGLDRTASQQRGSISEPVYLGSEYEGIVYHQWYSTRALTSAGSQVDDVPPGAIENALRETIRRFNAETRELTVVVGVRATDGSSAERLRNAKACLLALNLQDLPRWRYRIVLVEQDSAPKLKEVLAPFIDHYVFAPNPGPYNRSWGFNVGVAHSPARDDALCLSDADLLVPPDFLSGGLSALKEGARAVHPYTEVLYMDEVSTRKAIQERADTPMKALDWSRYRGRVFDTSQGGCTWVETTLYLEIGGHDERFRGWGREDREFWDRLSRATTIKSLPGRLLHLHHERPQMEDRWASANERLYEKLSRQALRSAPAGIGDLSLYAAEASLPANGASQSRVQHPSVGRRDWENWHSWDSARMEKIVRDEKALDPQASARRRLAQVVVELGSSLLDLGCGPGAMWPHFEPYRDRFSWAGADATPEMLATAHRLFPHVPVYHVDAGALPFEAGSFDVVLLRHVLEHLPAWLMEQTLSEAMRVARRAVVVDFYVPPARQGSGFTRRVGESFLETQWTAGQIDAVVRTANWHVSKQFSITPSTQAEDEVWVLTPTVLSEASDSGAATVPKISIIMPTYRRRHTILSTVETIQLQTYTNWELIIVDNAGDGNYSFDDERIRVYRHAEKASASFARNRGLRYARGDLVCFFDDDDHMFPSYLERIVEAFERNPQAKMVRCGMYVAGNRVNYSYATPECCLRREFATPTWLNDGPAQDQNYFRRIIAKQRWSEATGDIVMVDEVLCRANAHPRGGLRSGRY